jgi:predicted MFS family arabinose efflux permease
VLAPQLGGVIQFVAGWRGVFWTLVTFGLLIGLWVALGLSESRSEATAAQARSENPFRAYGALLRQRRLVGYGLAGALNGATLFTYISTAPALVMETYGFTPLVFNIIFAFNAVGIIGASQVNRPAAAPLHPGPGAGPGQHRLDHRRPAAGRRGLERAGRPAGRCCRCCSRPCRPTA